MFVRAGGIALSALAALAVAATPAFASLADEVAAGKAVAAQLQAGTASCATLTDAQSEHLGEYVMDRMAVTRAAHAAMNQRMEQAIGSASTDRMHELIGRRFAGCAAGDTSSVPIGPTMMGGGWGAMMGSRYAMHRHRGWSIAGVVGVVLGAPLVGAPVAVLVLRRPRQRPPAARSGA